MSENLATLASEAQHATDAVARQAYGKLVAWLSYQWRDISAAEDALSTAFIKALEVWPLQGVPDKPEGWLLSVARNELLQVARRKRLHNSPQIQALLDEEAEYEPAATIPDSRLKLMFVCAHPAIDPSIRPALMLQTVLGLDAQVIAQAMLMSPAAMAQRLVRAKNKIKQANLRFEEPGVDELPERLQAVLEAIYAAYGFGWDALDGGEVQVQGLRTEALYLAKVVCALLPYAPEAKGLLALMMFCEARIPARFVSQENAETADHLAFIPLSEQNTQLWQSDTIAAAETLLFEAAQANQAGAFQLEAAIQSAHCQRMHSGQTPWRAIALLYEALISNAPSVGASLAHALAWGQCGELEKANTLFLTVESTESAKLSDYQPYWVTKAHLAKLVGNMPLQQQCLTRAVGLSQSPAVKAYLSKQIV
jgi:RNA polymerase sigma-70 factor, ECF subfamily